MPLIATAGDPTANSYVTLLEATAFLQETLDHTAWDEAIDPVRVAALLTATRFINQAVDWYGTPVTTTQALPWPQTGQQDRWGRPVLSMLVPQDIKRTTALYALALLQEQGGMLPAMLTGVEEIQVPDVRIRFRSALPRAAAVQIPASIRALLLPYGDVVGSGTVRLVRS